MKWSWACTAVCAQVFEYINTDMKKWMDRHGKGPAHPLPKAHIKVGTWVCPATKLMHACVCMA